MKSVSKWIVSGLLICMAAHGQPPTEAEINALRAQAQGEQVSLEIARLFLATELLQEKYRESAKDYDPAVTFKDPVDNSLAQFVQSAAACRIMLPSTLLGNTWSAISAYGSGEKSLAFGFVAAAALQIVAVSSAPESIQNYLDGKQTPLAADQLKAIKDFDEKIREATGYLSNLLSLNAAQRTRFEQAVKATALKNVRLKLGSTMRQEMLPIDLIEIVAQENLVDGQQKAALLRLRGLIQSMSEEAFGDKDFDTVRKEFADVGFSFGDAKQVLRDLQSHLERQDEPRSLEFEEKYALSLEKTRLTTRVKDAIQNIDQMQE
ncbi:hypothetical protein K2X33_09415 [bacterium]|nr:hypothetical protein [bacterium]